MCRPSRSLRCPHAVAGLLTMIVAAACSATTNAPSAVAEDRGDAARQPSGNADANVHGNTDVSVSSTADVSVSGTRDANVSGNNEASVSSGAADTGAAREPSSGRFELAWEDPFDAPNPARWQLMTHTWDGNLAQFSADNVSYANGVASLLLTRAEGDVAKPFRGVEMRSRDTLTYGKVEARARFAGTSGVVSALVLIYTPWPADDWNELDIEYLGRYRDKIQFNAMVYTGPPTMAPVVTSVTPTPSPLLVGVTADPAADFHVYAIEWTPTDARFTIDGEVKRTWSTYIDRMRRPQNILLTIWASSTASWAGPIEPDTAPTQADYDWVRVYTWQPDMP